MTRDHPSLHRIQVANNYILRTPWLNTALLCPTSPYPAGGTLSPTTLLDKCFRTEDRRGSLGKMRPLPATASQGKSPVPP